MSKKRSKKKKITFFISSVVFLVLGLFLSLSQAQSENKYSKDLQLASAQLSETQALLPVISMDFQDADLKDVLKVFSQQAKLNFIASENVKDRKVTLYLDKVSVEDALTTIMRANNLTFEQMKDSEIFVVNESGKPQVETITKVFPLQYARVKGYELTEEGKKREAKIEIGIKDVIDRLLSEHGQAVEDSRSNSLIVSDLPSQFSRIESAIEELDIKLPQVMIEVEVVETSLDTIDKLGIEWGSANDGILFQGAGSSKTTKWPFMDKGEGVGPGGDVSGLNMGYLSAMSLGGTLAMLATDTDTKILARPKILTLNNETAEIKLTADTAIASLQETSSAEGIATQTVTAERVETGVALKVTPQINKLHEITLLLEPSVTNTKWSTYFPNSFVDPQTRSAKTTVTVRDGETIIIGGLIDIKDSKITRKVPFLGDIPLLGNIFRKKEDEVNDTELIIFITPHLIEEGEAAPGLALEKQAPWEYENLGLKEEAMEMFLDRFEE